MIFLFAEDSRHYLEIGREHFVGRNTMAPPELQRVRSPEEAHRRFKVMFRGLFGHARKRGVEIGFTMDPTEIPTNFARWMRRLDRVPAHRRIAGMRVDFTDPLFEEHTKTWLSALFETYPGGGGSLPLERRGVPRLPGTPRIA